MGDAIQISRVAKRYSSHTMAHSRAAGYRPPSDTKARRDQLIAAMVEVISDGGDPRLGESRPLP